MNASRLVAAVCVAALLAGCATTNRNASALPLALAAPATGVERARKGRLTIRIRIPKKRHQRGARYISAATKGMTLAFVGPTTRTQVVNLTPSDPRCSGSPLTCTIAIALLAGSYTVTVNTYDRAPSGGSIPVAANLLSTAKNVAFTMTGGIKNAIGITLDGVPASFIVAGLPSATVGTPFATPQAFSVHAKDADGDTIVGTYDSPVTLSNSDTTGTTSVTTSGSDSPPVRKLLSSSDTAKLSYNGVGIVSATITASATGATNGTGTFAPTQAAPTLTTLSSPSGVAGSSVSETLTGTNFYAGTTVAAGGTGVTVNGVSVTSATSLTVTFVLAPGATFGSRNVTVTTPAGTSSAQPFFVATGSIVVTSAADSGPGTLRSAIATANAMPPGEAITFRCGPPCTITLSSALPPITENMVVDGGAFGNVVIDGANSYRAFFVDTGTVLLADLQIANTLAVGGAGGASYSAGGGGAGLGAGLFVNQSTAAVTVANTYFLNDIAVGGAGGGLAPNASGGGGGGLGSSGGDGDGFENGSGGGGGVLSAGGPGNQGIGGNGGNGGGGGGGGCSCFPTTRPGGTGGAFYAGSANGNGADGSAGSGGVADGAGGVGGFGGGGGGAGSGGGAGGFGGGGGGASGLPGAGGPGGGGGGTVNPGSAAGGSLGSGVKGGNGGQNGGGGGGGGGAAAGPAIFVNAGSLLTSNSGATGSSATGGAGGASSVGGAPGTADSTPVFNYAGTVNGSATTGPIASALAGTAPSGRRRHHVRR